MNWLMCALFLVAAVVQWNDPDPARWIAIYGAAFALCLLVALRRRPGIVAPAIVAAVALVWAVTIIARGPAVTQYLHMFDAWHMTSARVDEAREASGLLIVAGWMGVLAMSQRRGGTQ